MVALRLTFPVLLCAVVFWCGCLSRQTGGSATPLHKKSDIASISGGNGGSFDSAVVLSGGKDHLVAVAGEQRFISSLYGVKDKDWSIVEQTTTEENGKVFDMVRVLVNASKEMHFVYFDITWYSKHKTPHE